ncbi:MAG: hypothetical protein IPK08_17815, partial [Bacteroidetes bacterium]|nr:hypothetical protein [Bacteroidota bacterium]
MGNLFPTTSNEFANTAQNTVTSSPVSPATPKSSGEQSGGDHAAHSATLEINGDEIK